MCLLGVGCCLSGLVWLSFINSDRFLTKLLTDRGQVQARTRAEETIIADFDEALREDVL